MQPYPDAETVLLDLLEPIAPAVTSLPARFEPPMIVVERVGGAPDPDDVTDYPLLQVSCYGARRPDAWSLSGQCQVAILSSPCSEVNGVLIDYAEVAIGGQQVPDMDPDDRRVVSTYRLGFRRH